MIIIGLLLLCEHESGKSNVSVTKSRECLVTLGHTATGNEGPPPRESHITLVITLRDGFSFPIVGTNPTKSHDKKSSPKAYYPR